MISIAILPCVCFPGSTFTPEAEGIEQSAGYAMSVARPFLYFTKEAKFINMI